MYSTTGSTGGSRPASPAPQGGFRERELVHKRRDYAEATIPEYWIVDPGTETIVVLELGQGGYVERGVYGRGDRARSPALSGFGVDVDSVFDAAGGE